MPAGLTFVLRHIRRLAGPADGADDARLVASFAACRNEEAFTLLVGRHGPMVIGVCRRLLGNDADAEDAFQAVFLVLARKAASLGGTRSLGGWLHEVALRTALKARAGRDRRRLHERRAAAMAVTSEAAGETDDLRPVLDEELARLPEKYRLPLVLCDLQGRSHGEAAAEVGCPVGSVSWRLARGRELLRRRLVRRGVTLTAAALAGLLAERGSVPVSAALTRATVGAALAFAAGAAALRPTLAVLAEEVLKGLAVGRARALALVALAVTVLALGGGLLAYQPRAEPPGPVEAAAPAGNPRADPQGDPLPAGALMRLGTRRWRVGEDVHLLECSPDGKVLAVADRSGIALWHAATGKPLGRPEGGAGHASALAFTPDGKALALAVGDWPGGKGRSDPRPRPVRLVVVPSGKLVREWAAPETSDATALAFSPDGKLLAVGDGTGQVLLCAWERGTVRGRVGGGGGAVVRLAFSADGRRLAVAHAEALRVWDVSADAAGVRVTEAPRPEAAKCRGPLALGFRADDGALVAVDEAGHCRAWDATGKLLAQFPDPDQFLDLKSATLSRDGARVVPTGNYVLNWPTVFDTATGKEVARGSADNPRPLCHQFSPDGRTLVGVERSGALRFWDARTGTEDLRAEGHAGHLWCADLSADGRTAVTAGADNTAAVWDAATGRRRQVVTVPYDPYSVILAPHGKSFLTGGSDGCVRRWDAGTGKKLFETKVVGCVYRLAYSPDGRLVACGAHSHAALLDAGTGRVVHQLAPDDRPIYHHVAFSADGRRLATGTGYSGREETSKAVDLWDVATGEHLRRFEGPSIVRQVSLSPDGTRLRADCDGASVTWDTRTGSRLRAVTPAARLLPQALSPDGRTLAGADEDGVALVERASGGRRRTFRGHSGGIVAMQFSRDGRRLISGAGDTTALVWDVTGGRAKRADLSTRQMAERWEALAADDAGAAFDALWDLVAAPGTVAFLRERLKAVPEPDAKAVARLIAGLDSETFEEREAATAELNRLGELAEPALTALVAGRPSAEARSRAGELLKRLREPGDGRLTGEALRQVRAVELLETLGTAEARELLDVLAKGAPGALLTREARESLGRLR